jgi:DNA-binding FrmR family transcriptional regulator
MRGQIEAIERAVDADNECATVLQRRVGRLHR